MRRKKKKQVFPDLNTVHSEKRLAPSNQNSNVGCLVKEKFFFFFFEFIGFMSQMLCCWMRMFGLGNLELTLLVSHLEVSQALTEPTATYSDVQGAKLELIL